MNGKKARALRRLAIKENREPNELKSYSRTVVLVDKDNNRTEIEVSTRAYSGWVRMYRGLKKWRKTKMGIISKGHS